MRKHTHALTLSLSFLVPQKCITSFVVFFFSSSFTLSFLSMLMIPIYFKRRGTACCKQSTALNPSRRLMVRHSPRLSKFQGNKMLDDYFYRCPCFKCPTGEWVCLTNQPSAQTEKRIVLSPCAHLSYK